jgi:hypothetical protein
LSPLRLPFRHLGILKKRRLRPVILAKVACAAMALSGPNHASIPMLNFDCLSDGDEHATLRFGYLNGDELGWSLIAASYYRSEY